jgi:calcineurin-like phosphoesterase family protein
VVGLTRLGLGRVYRMCPRSSILREQRKRKRDIKMKTFFTSDLHFFHDNVIRFCNRPFGSVEHMNDTLIKNWNMVVGEGDHVWFLGDFSFGKPEETMGVLRQLKGLKHLIVGNHDRNGRCDKLFNRDWSNWFVERHDYVRVKIDGHKFALCHFPFYSWERGYINLHGHIHSLAGYKNKWKQYDVGVDANNYTPILLEDVVKRAEEGERTVTAIEIVGE